MTEQAFKGTLLLLQNRTKRAPDAYREEFRAQLEHFFALTKTVNLNQSHSNPQFLAVMSYVCHCSHCFPKECALVGQEIISMLVTHKTTLHPDTRLAVVKCLMLLRSKNLVSAETVLPIFFDMLQLRDKALRKSILAHLVGDIRRINQPGAKGSAISAITVNKSVQNFLFSVLAEDDAVQTRCALLVMIDLYRRNVWADEKTVHALTGACFSKHTLIVRMCLRFFLMQMPKVSSIDSDSDEDPDPGRAISKMKQKLKVKKKTKKRERVLDRSVNKEKNRYDKERKAEEAQAKAHIDPVRLLRDPHQFAERLLAKLQRTTERFETRILFFNVIARVVQEHDVVLLPLYSFLERYMEPSQLHATQLLALSAMCVHSQVPPDAVEPLVRAIANHFVNDRSSPDSITIGINTIREICKRQPLAMNKSLLSDLAEYKGQRGDRGVMMAARALMQLYRDVHPELLPVKYMGTAKQAAAHAMRKGGTAGQVVNAPKFGAPSPLQQIPGMELLMQYTDEFKAAAEAGEDVDSDVSSGDELDEFEAFNENEDDDSDDGSWINVSHTDDSDDDDLFSAADDDDDECPQLVSANPTTASPPKTAAVAAAKKKKAGVVAASASAPSSSATKNGRPSAGAGAGEVEGRGSALHNPLMPEDDSDVWVDSDEDDDDDDDEFEEEEEEEEPPAKVRITDARARVPTKAKPQQATADDDLNESDDEDSSDDDGDDEGGWEGWEECSEDDEEDDDEEEDEESDYDGSSDDDDEESEAESSASSAEAAAAAATANVQKKKGEEEQNGGDGEWFVDTDARRAVSKDSVGTAGTGKHSTTTSTGTAATLGSYRILTDADFAKMKKYATYTSNESHRTLRGKQKDADERNKKREAIIHGISADLGSADIETFTEKKRLLDKEQKIAQTQELRSASQKFNARQKKKSKLNSTHTEHSKRGKLFSMTKRSARVAEKLKRSIVDRNSRKKDMAKKDVKFRIKRGWKA